MKIWEEIILLYMCCVLPNFYAHLYKNNDNEAHILCIDVLSPLKYM